MGRSRLPDDVMQKLLAVLGDELGTISNIEDAFEDLKAQIGQEGIDKKLHDLPPEDGRAFGVVSPCLPTR